MILPTFASFARALILLSVGVSGQLLHNITIDDTDPTITYTGPWQVDPPEYPTFYQGGHHWSSQSGAYATFTFTGVAVYYLAPLYSGYEGGVSTLLSLDSGPAQFVNLTSGGLEPVVYAVRWSASGLANRTHTVMNTLGRSAQGELTMWAVVDGFIYTVQDPPIPSSTQTSSTQTSAPNPTGSSIGSVSSPKSIPVGAIAGGVVGGVAVGIVLLGLLAHFLVFKKTFIRKGSKSEDANGRDDSLDGSHGRLGSSPQMRDQGGHSTYYNGSSQGSAGASVSPSQGSFNYRGLPEPSNE